MSQAAVQQNIFEEKSVWKILLHIAPPVMLAQLIQAMYNIVDSYFVGRFSEDGLTALSVVYPIQLIAIAVAVGTGVGVNTLMSRHYAHQEQRRANETAGTGVVLALISWGVFALLSVLLMRPYVQLSADAPAAVEYAVTYGTIVCVGSLGLFLESIWTKIHQAGGNMRLPMIAQIAGALTNIVLDPILIFGLGFVPALGVSGAAYATVAGQIVAAVITSSGFRKPPKAIRMWIYTKKIYKLGFPSIFMQMLFTVYIVALNMILAGFSDAAVTVLGLYYKIQSFFFIPLCGLETCIVPLLSYTYAKNEYTRCKKVMTNSVLLAMGFMLAGVACFELIPGQLLNIFHPAPDVITIGIPAFRLIGASFVPAVISLLMPVFFQAIGEALPSVLLSLTRQIFCLIPIFWLLSKISLDYTWLAFPLAEIITSSLGLLLYTRQLRIWRLYQSKAAGVETGGKVAMKLITAIVSKKDTNEVCKALSEAGFYFTKMASTGGFLTAGNTTLMIGTENDKVAQVLDVIRTNCSRRVEKISSNVQLAVPSAVAPTEVSVGGATVFVTEVEQFEKM